MTSYSYNTSRSTLPGRIAKNSERQYYDNFVTSKKFAVEMHKRHQYWNRQRQAEESISDTETAEEEGTRSVLDLSDPHRSGQCVG